MSKGFYQMSSNKELNNLISLVSNVTDAHTSALFWLDEEQNRLRLRAVYSLSQHLCPEVSIELGCGLVGWVAKNAKPVNVAKFNHDPKTLQYYTTEENIKSFVAVPVMNNGKLVGVLSADSKRNYLFTNKYQKLLGCFAQQFSLLIERQQQLEEIGEQARGYNWLYQLCSRLANSGWQNIFNALLDVSQDMLEFDNLVVALLNETRDSLKLVLAHGEECTALLDKCFPASQGLAGLILKHKKPLLLNNLSQRKGMVFGRQGPKWEMDSFLGLPLWCADRVIGILAYTSFSSTAFNRQDEQLASVVALQVAAIISQWQMQQARELQPQLDGLTGLLNHRAFQQHLKHRVQAATLLHPLSLLLIRVNQLARINQQCGYEVGDQILSRLARILSGVALDKERVSRFGGQKFALSLDNTEPAEALAVAQRICHIIEHSRFVIGGRQLKVSLSIGLASCPTDALDLPQLVDYAQRALKLAQKRNQNHVCTFHNLLTSVSA